MILTTHSMEEADVLSDRIAIMASGQLAAVGSSMALKSEFGAGYTLSVLTRPSAQPGCHSAGSPLPLLRDCLIWYLRCFPSPAPRYWMAVFILGAVFIQELPWRQW